jgi:hypothetical protein
MAIAKKKNQKLNDTETTDFERSALKKKHSSAGSHPVLLHVTHNSIPSEHVVDLRQKKSALDSVAAYKEKPISTPKRVTLDLSAMVKEANKKQPKRHIPSPSFLKPTMEGTPKKKIAEKVTPVSFLPDPTLTQKDFEEVDLKDETCQTEDKVLEVQGVVFKGFDWTAFVYKVVAVLFLLILPFPVVAYYHEIQHNTNQVVGETTTAFLSLQASTVAALSADIPQAQADLTQALNSFSGAEAILDKEHKVLQYVAGLLPVIGSEVHSRQSILQAGHHLALGNTYLVQGIRAAREQKQKNLIEKIALVDIHLKSALPQYKEAQVALNNVKTQSLPVEYQASFEQFRNLFAAFINDMQDLNTLSKSIQTVFGGDDFRRYLVVFQNNHELRATGGFPGSMAIIDVQKGKILNVDVPGGGPYDLKGQLGLYVVPPAPLLLTNGRFEFQDTNWWPDFPSSAEKMSQFYENARGASVDGVIALNATVLEKVLGVLGPVQNVENNVTLSSENALEVLQQKVEKDYDKEANTPKAIIGDVFHDLMGQLSSLDAAKSLQLLTAVQSSLDEKAIQVYMKDKNVEKDLSEFGWTGEVLNSNLPNQDYLMIVQSNLQGQKSDAKMDQSIEHQVLVDENGEVTDTVIIRRKHNGEQGEEFYGAANISYVRVYVPQGAKLLDAGGFTYPPEEAFHVSEKWYTQDNEVQNLEKEVNVHSKTGTRISEGFGKTIFGNWMITLPGETSETYFVYKLPFTVVSKEQFQKDPDWKEKLFGTHLKETSTYKLLVQSQSGIASDFVSSIIYKDGWIPSWVSDENNFVKAKNGVKYHSILSRQETLGIVMEKEIQK